LSLSGSLELNWTASTNSTKYFFEVLRPLVCVDMSVESRPIRPPGRPEVGLFRLRLATGVDSPGESILIARLRDQTDQTIQSSLTIWLNTQFSSGHRGGRSNLHNCGHSTPFLDLWFPSQFHFNLSFVVLGPVPSDLITYLAHFPIEAFLTAKGVSEAHTGGFRPCGWPLYLFFSRITILFSNYLYL